MKTPNEIINDYLVGKTLISKEFGDDKINKEIIKTRIGMEECHEDSGIWLTFKDNTELFIFNNEGLELI